MPIRRSQKKRNAEPRQKQNHRSVVIDPMVNPGSSAHRHQARPRADPTRTHHRMVTMAQSSPSDRSACAPQSKTTTVMLGGGAGDILRIARPNCVQAKASGAEMCNLQEAANDHDILEKMDHLISVSKVVVKEDRRCQREHRKTRRHLPRTKTKDKQQPAADFKGNGDCPAQWRQRQTHAADVGCRRPEGSKLAEAAHEERQTDKDTTKQWQKSCSFHVRPSSRHLRRRYTTVETATANCHRRAIM